MMYYSTTFTWDGSQWLDFLWFIFIPYQGSAAVDMNGYAFAISADDHPLAVVEADPQMANLGETKER